MKELKMDKNPTETMQALQEQQEASFAMVQGSLAEVKEGIDAQTKKFEECSPAKKEELAG